MHAACERARQWSSAEVDGELSRFERVLLAAHLAGCAPCREFHAATSAFTSILRATPLELPEPAVEIGRAPRRLRLRLAPAVAAMAVAAVGLGSVLASTELRAGSVGSTSSAAAQDSGLADADAISSRTLQGRERVPAQPAPPTSASQLRRPGGPVVNER